MSAKVIVGLLVLVAVAIGIGVSMDGGEAADSAALNAPLQSTERPLDAPQLPREAKPRDILGDYTSALRQGATSSEAFAPYQGVWLSDRGWTGESRFVTKKGGYTIVEYEVYDPRVVGFVHVVAKMPGDHDFKKKQAFRATGRICLIEPSDNVNFVPHRIYIDCAKPLPPG
jgi:hypothetical protein